ncbi:MAG: SDR family NAD(P)-dependent oxidoreductase [Alistipes sp.]|nr:SDR family NAD(P)-dependent oxidoreductase [Alistipes sp.]
MKAKQTKAPHSALILGASSGIGEAVALQLAAQGCRVILTGRRREALQAIVATDPEHLTALPCDITHPDILERLNAALTTPLDLILLCAGTGDLNQALDYQIEERTNAVNVVGFTRIVGWAYGYLAQQGGGTLAAITSVMGLRGSGSAPSYAASKAYQINYLEGLRQQATQAKLPIQILDLRPGSVRTAMMKGEGHFWIASAEEAATTICRAVQGRGCVQYVTPRWRWIGRILWLLPRGLYAKLGA